MAGTATSTATTAMTTTTCKRDREQRERERLREKERDKDRDRDRDREKDRERTSEKKDRHNLASAQAVVTPTVLPLPIAPRRTERTEIVDVDSPLTQDGSVDELEEQASKRAKTGGTGIAPGDLGSSNTAAGKDEGKRAASDGTEGTHKSRATSAPGAAATNTNGTSRPVITISTSSSQQPPANFGSTASHRKRASQTLLSETFAPLFEASFTLPNTKKEAETFLTLAHDLTTWVKRDLHARCKATKIFIETLAEEDCSDSKMTIRGTTHQQQLQSQQQNQATSLSSAWALRQQHQQAWAAYHHHQQQQQQQQQVTVPANAFLQQAYPALQPSPQAALCSPFKHSPPSHAYQHPHIDAYLDHHGVPHRQQERKAGGGGTEGRPTSGTGGVGGGVGNGGSASSKYASDKSSAI